MRRYQKFLVFGRTAKAVTAAFALMAMLALGVFASSPSLHHRIHPDSGRVDHFCAICAFASGHLNWTHSVPAIAVAAMFVIRTRLPGERPLISNLDFYSCPNRAPPRS
jgi:hypothetical protein